ncbi:hypothetical protein K466DRAFT_606431 [Polyporus arcularius HHB13444]|uniref:CxC1-like cysteine cluster associated with KDZ transposases domain-containing protein n=1 Tax=Polyporus arcularius HHB13444 TaxID=1314778 RepID=A0A5C3NPW9_9APHY|nr:hypothetical protein K466DRAFT_606431 [Polyporus arcularius HHB13444]
MSTKGRSYVSSSVDIRTYDGFGRRPKIDHLKLSQSHKRRAERKRIRLQQISGLSFQDRQDVMAIDGDDGDASEDEGWQTLPPGEEGMFLSNAGGEDELCKAIFDDMQLPHKRYDPRTRHDRTEIRNREWDLQLEELVTAYMTWQANLPSRQSVEPSNAEGLPFNMLTVNFLDTGQRTFRRPTPDTKANVAMVLEGYIGTAPTSPTVALSFDVLEVYRQYHRVCPRLSIQAHVRALCHLHRVPYWKGLVEQFSNTYDVYLNILHRIDSRVRTVLKQDTPDWRMRNACAPCLYVLEDERKLRHSLLATMDGNQSLKLVDSVFRAGTPLQDSRQARTDFWIPTEEVDRFKDEVGHAKRAAASTTQRAEWPPGDTDDDALLENLDADGTPEEVASICVERWKAAGPEARKKMFALFAVSGVFVCLCRHGHILIMCDMIRSGELMKYPLAIINRLLEVYGPDILVGYDIGCEFTKTLEHSSLGPRAKAKGLSCIVPAFHGHSHNRGCQVQYHPLYFVGAGKEDFEGCERLFSESNGLAPGTRLATPFHRHQAIEQFAQFWSRQKHAESGNFIYNNYKQALSILSEDTAAFEVIAAKLAITHEDCDMYLVQEREYLAKRKSEPPEVAAKIDYVAALLRLEKAGREAVAAKNAEASLNPFIVVNNAKAAKKHEAQIKRVRTCARTMHSRWAIAEEAALQMEEDLSIEKRWMPGSREYAEGIEELQCRKYRLALDNLERLVIQRMFELTKLGMSGIGYKLREKIGKALRTRADAIRHALDEYNKCAAALSSPRPALAWHDIMDMASLAEFDLLRDAREDIRDYPWATRLNRQAMNLHFNIMRAREEIERLDVEIPRLFTALIDRHFDCQRAMVSLKDTDPALAHEFHLRWLYEDRISTRIAARLYATSQLKGFTGRLAAGKRVGREAGSFDGINLPTWACNAPEGELHGRAGAQQGMCGEQDDDAVNHDDENTAIIPGVENERDAVRFVDFIDSLGQDLD